MLSHTKRQIILKHFKCQNSGHCCRRSGYVFVTDPEIQAMAAKLNMPMVDFLRDHVRPHNGYRVVASPTFRPTCFLDQKNCCSVYEARPAECRTYPDWPSIWESEETLQEEIASCPGLKKAYEQAQGELLKVPEQFEVENRLFEADDLH